MNQPNLDLGNRSEFLQELEMIVITRLAGHISQVQFTESTDGLVLRGFCRSFYAKQMVQELLMQLGNFRVIANEIVVVEVKGKDKLRAHAAEVEMSDHSLTR